MAKLFKRTLLIALLALVLSVLSVQFIRPLLVGRPPAGELTIEQIQNLASLTTARVQVSDVMLVELKGLTGGMQVAVVLKGDYLIGTDLSQGRFASIDAQRHTAVLILPPPRVHEARLDLEHSRTFGLSTYGLWQIVPGDSGYTALVNKAYGQAQGKVARIAGGGAGLPPARASREGVKIIPGRTGLGRARSVAGPERTRTPNTKEFHQEAGSRPRRAIVKIKNQNRRP